MVDATDTEEDRTSRAWIAAFIVAGIVAACIAVFVASAVIEGCATAITTPAPPDPVQTEPDSGGGTYSPEDRPPDATPLYPYAD